MSGAFDIAWSVLKALPEQQAFAQQIVPPEQFGQKPATPQTRLGTVPPPILGAMRRKQGEYITGSEKEGVEHFERHPEYLGMGIEKPFSYPEQPARREGQLTQVPTTLDQSGADSRFADDATQHVKLSQWGDDRDQDLRGSVFGPANRTSKTPAIRYSAKDSFREVPSDMRQFDPNAAAAYLQSIGF
tara:strand:+ start:707 stop:1267 length:561 start_codon:yes stop_codon:yes gene_type:complete